MAIAPDFDSQDEDENEVEPPIGSFPGDALGSADDYMDDDFGQNVEGNGHNNPDDDDMAGSIQQRAAEAELERGWELPRSEPPPGV
jgi:hypothetical protein